jgi:hypothetical protein
MAQFNVGEDMQGTINGPFGEIQIPLDTMFNYEQSSVIVQVPCIDGITRSRTVFGNWTGTISTARANTAMDDLAQQIQDTCLSDGMIPDGSISVTIYNIDGSTSNYTFTGVSFNVKQLGDFSAKKAVMQTLQFVAEKRIQA